MDEEDGVVVTRLFNVVDEEDGVIIQLLLSEGAGWKGRLATIVTRGKRSRSIRRFVIQ